ncbi:hypothetical protein HZS_6013 [Henneguya salminicola]|nr:hypothetical protein HZS_6013 [Henneguya salminicola]
MRIEDEEEVNENGFLKKEKIYCDLIIHETFYKLYRNEIAARITIISIIQQNNARIASLRLRTKNNIMQHHISKMIYISTENNNFIDISNNDTNKMFNKFNNYNEINYPDYCQSVLFIGKDLNNILGLSNIGTNEGRYRYPDYYNSGIGICGNEASFIVSAILQETLLPFPIISTIFAHEWGHTMGCEVYSIISN